MRYCLYTWVVILCSVLEIQSVSTTNMTDDESLRIGRNGRRNTTIEDHPWQVSLQKATGSGGAVHICGGSIISARRVLTAAHCLYYEHEDRKIRREDLSVLVGVTNMTSTDGTLRFKVEDILFHVNHTNSNLKFDIAVLKIKGEFDFNSTALRYIKLPSPDETFDVNDWTDCTHTGWGGYSGHMLNEMEAPLVSNEECQDGFEALLEDLNQTEQRISPFLNVLNDKVCAGLNSTYGSCQGDSGGPLVCTGRNGTGHDGEKVLIGSVSFFVFPFLLDTPEKRERAKDCKEKANLWDVYTDNFQYSEWLCQNIFELGCSTDLPVSHVVLLLFVYFFIITCCIVCVVYLRKTQKARQAKNPNAAKKVGGLQRKPNQTYYKQTPEGLIKVPVPTNVPAGYRMQTAQSSPSPNLQSRSNRDDTRSRSKRLTNAASASSVMQMRNIDSSHINIIPTHSRSNAKSS